MNSPGQRAVSRLRLLYGDQQLEVAKKRLCVRMKKRLERAKIAVQPR